MQPTTKKQYVVMGYPVCGPLGIYAHSISVYDNNDVHHWFVGLCVYVHYMSVCVCLADVSLKFLVIR